MLNKILILVAISFFFQISYSQTKSELISVQLSATMQTTPAPQIIINWLNDGSGTSYSVFRRQNTTDAWSFLIKLGDTEMSYVDTDINSGIPYEYKVVKEGFKYAYGYINTAIDLPAIINRGILILVVEDTYLGNTNFDNAIKQTKRDIENDGWLVEQINVNRNDAVTSVKSSILSIYNQNPTETKAIYLIGHVPVPYSGLLNPDGHSNHYGAWATDAFYSDVDGVWSDSSVYNTTASQSRNHNIPGDGKYDASYISSTELQIGRVDFENMPAFTQTEEQLLITYLNKSHAYKIKAFEAVERGLIDDNFTSFSEGFASNGYRNFSTMFTPSNINNTLDLRNATTTDSYMWTYGCGGGKYFNCNGIGSTTDFASDSLQTIFMMIFGSYFGDWDSNDNYLRAAIAQGQTLNSFWAGRPHWQVHHMALGNNIGFSSLLTQNNSLDYYSNYPAKGIHISLMGDPTVRMHYIIPPSSLEIVENNSTIELYWTASTDDVLGYNIYRLDKNTTSYLKVNESVVSDTNFVDNTIIDNGMYTYIVKSVNLKTTASGSYYNQSLGIRKDITFTTLGFNEYNHPEIILYPNPTTGVVFINLSKVEHNVKATLSNNLGQIIFKGKYGSTDQFSININAPSGIYFLKCELSNNIIFDKKIIKK
jgi:hypothetical protein